MEQQKRMQEQMQANMERQRAQMAQAGRGAAGAMGRGGPGGPPGAAGGSTPGADLTPGDFTSPTGAVTAFLKALEAKDLDRLSESTALRASREANSEKNRELFAKISDLSLSASDLDELAKKFEGYHVGWENPPKSTGRVDVVIQKQGEGGSFLRRRVTARHERNGWKVGDISGSSEFKMPGYRPPTKAGGRRS
jgi:hypothetical protein